MLLRSEEHPSGAEALVVQSALSARDPEGAPVVPFYKAIENLHLVSFSAACEVAPFLQSG